MNRRQVLIGSGATGLVFTSTASPWNIALAAPLARAAPVRLDDIVSVELGGLVHGTYQIRATSVTHHTLV